MPPFAPKYGTDPEYIVLDQTTPKGEGADNWHSDNTFMAEPPLGSILKAVKLPSVGGDTCFASMYAAFEALSPALQQMLRGLSAEHDLTKPLQKAIAAGHSDANLAEVQEKYGGYNFKYQEVTNRGHGWPPGGPLPALQWIGEHRRDPRPKKVVWEPVLPWKKQFYWLRWDEPKSGFIVEAELDRENNAIHLKAPDALRGFRVLLDEPMLDLEREVVITKDGEERFRGKPTRRLATILFTGAKGDEGLTFEHEILLPVP